MLKMMQSESSKDWSLQEILSACDWSDQAVAVGAGLGLSNTGLVVMEENVENLVKLFSFLDHLFVDAPQVLATTSDI